MNQRKSVIALLIARLIKPAHLVQALSLHRLANRFDPEHLITTKLNITSEINADEIKDTGILKQIISEEPIFVEQKSKCGYTATPHCKLLCASNQMPTFGNLDSSGNEALYDRMEILRYNHSIPPEKDDKELGEKLYACRDVWGSLAVDALVELVQNGFQFTESEDAKELRRIAQQEDLSLRLFLLYIPCNCQCRVDVAGGSAACEQYLHIYSFKSPSARGVFAQNRAAEGIGGFKLCSFNVCRARD